MKNSTKQSRPLGPKGSFLLGNTKGFAQNTLKYISEIGETYGREGIALIRVAFRDFYLLYRPDYIAHVLRSNHKNYTKSVAYKVLRPALGMGLLTAEGDFWKKQRRLLQPPFHKKNIAGLTDEMVAECRQFIDEKIRPGERFEMRKTMLDISQKILSRTLFGTGSEDLPHSERIGEILDILREFADNRLKNPFSPPLFLPTAKNRELKKALREIKESVRAIIRQRRENPSEKNDLLQILLNLQDADSGEKMSEQQLIDEVMTIFVAGQETTANSLTFSFFLLSKNREIAQKLHESCRNLPAVPLFEHFTPNDYSLQVINESMRIYPPAWAISRQARADDEIGGYKIPAGATVFIPIRTLHMNPAFWPDPETFRPERFEEDYEKDTFLPFASGPRVCIGNHFAMSEMQIILSMIYREFYLKLSPDTEMELKTPITMSSKKPLYFEVKRF